MARAKSITPAQGLDVKAAIWAGLIAGVVFMMMEMILVAAMGDSPWVHRG